MNTRTEQVGSLNCHIVDNLPSGVEPKLVVVLCHGYGAPGSDLAPLGSEVFRNWPVLADQVQFVFPEAPLSLDHLGFYGGRAWWNLRVDGLQAKILQGELREIDGNVPPELLESRQMLTETIQLLSKNTNVPLNRFAMGGFSQGSIISLDVALRFGETVASVFVWSGTLVAEKEWKRLAAKHSGLSIIQSHGTTDLVLPFKAAEWLRDAMVDTGAEVDFISFDDGHTIPMAALKKFGERLVSLVANQSTDEPKPIG